MQVISKRYRQIVKKMILKDFRKIWFFVFFGLFLCGKLPTFLVENDKYEMHLQVSQNCFHGSYMLDLGSLMINLVIQKSCGTPRGTQVVMCGVSVAIAKMPKYRIFDQYYPQSQKYQFFESKFDIWGWKRVKLPKISKTSNRIVEKIILNEFLKSRFSAILGDFALENPFVDHTNMPLRGHL